MVNEEKLAPDAEKSKCRRCKELSTPDIMTAYQNVGESLSELYHCCSNGNDKSKNEKTFNK